MKIKTPWLILAGLFLGTAVSAVAGRPTYHYETLRAAEQFRQLRPGEKVLYVCSQCQTVTEQTIESTAQAMDHCKEGATITCPSCRKAYKMVLTGHPKNPGLTQQVKYVNAKGEECLFVAKASAKK